MASEPPADESSSGLSDHLADTVEAVVSFHEEHYGAATRLQRAFEAVVAVLARPGAALATILGLGAWAIVAAFASHGRGDGPVFAWLEFASTLAALVIALMILVTQRRQEDLAERRAKLTLELAILADKRMAKTISLLEELRRDAPDVADRDDPESADMAAPADPHEMINAIDERAAASPGPGHAPK